MALWEKALDKIIQGRIDRDTARKNIELAHKLVDRDKQEKLYQRAFSVIIFIAGLVLVFAKNFLELGLFAIGSGLYGLAPESKQKKSNFPVPLIKVKDDLFQSVLFFLLIIISIGAILYFSDGNAKGKISQILWVILGILTMCFINAFKQFINNRTG